MSEMEYHRGRMVKYWEGEGVYNIIKSLESEGKINSEYFEDYGEGDYYLEPESGYFVAGNAIYEVLDHESNEYGFNHARIDDIGEISFMCSFYNGGTCLSETLGELVQDLG